MPTPKYGLRLKAVRVQDFKSLREVTLELSPTTTVLLGENNSGKTSFLEALDVAFGKRHPRLEDLHQGPAGRASNFAVDLRIEPEVVGEDFAQGVVNAVGVGIQFDDANTPYFAIRVTGALSAEGWDISLTRKFLKGWAADRASAAKLTTLPSPPVGRPVLDLLHFDVLDARRDIVEQLRNRRTYWGRTASNVEIAPAVKGNLETTLQQLGKDLTANSPVLSRVRDDLRDLSDGLSSGKLTVELEALPRSVDDLIRAMDIMITSTNSSTFPVESHGMGTRSLAALLVFRSYVNVVRAKQKPEQQLSVAAFEEPEAHLHPQAQRAVFQILSQIGGQRLVSTHSTHVAETADADAYRLFRRVGAETRVSAVPNKVVGAWDKELVRRFVQLDNPEILFAKAVGIVEGQTEATLFPVLARSWWAPHGADSKGVSIIHTQSAGNSKHIVPMLETLGIPWVLFCDGDGAGLKGLEATAALIGRHLDSTSNEVLMLPNGNTFETYIIDEGSLSFACAAADKHPEGDLERYMKANEGNKRGGTNPRGGPIRNYTGTDGKMLGCLDFLIRHKGTIGALLATEMIGAPGSTPGASFPPLIREFFVRLDKARGP